PYVLQLNKRDLPNAMAVPELTKQLQKKGEPVLEAVAVTGQGVFETLREVAKLVLAELKKSGERLELFADCGCRRRRWRDDSEPERNRDVDDHRNRLSLK